MGRDCFGVFHQQMFVFFRVLATLFPKCDSLLQATLKNRRCWEHATGLFTQRWEKGHSSLEILRDPDLEAIVLEAQQTQKSSPEKS